MVRTYGATRRPREFPNWETRTNDYLYRTKYGHVPRGTSFANIAKFTGDYFNIYNSSGEKNEHCNNRSIGHYGSTLRTPAITVL